MLYERHLKNEAKKFRDKFNLYDLFGQLSELLKFRHSRYVNIKVLIFGTIILPFFLTSKMRNFLSRKNTAYQFSIHNLYNSCRKSLAYYNNFSIDVKSDCTFSSHTELSNFIYTIAKCIRERKSISRGFRSYRIARRLCDKSVIPQEADFFVILIEKNIYKVPLNIEQKSLKFFLADVFHHMLKNDEILASESKNVLTACSAMERSPWSKLEKLFNDSDTEKLQLLRKGRFVLCMDTTKSESASHKSNIDNRFFDKAIQICINIYRNKLTFIFEHSSFDGARAATISKELMAYIDKCKTGSRKFVKSDKIEHGCKRYNNIIESEQVLSLYFEEREKLEKISRLYFEKHASVYLSNHQQRLGDCMVQLAIFLAYYEVFGITPSMYEPVEIFSLGNSSLDFIDPIVIPQRFLRQENQRFDIPRNLDQLIAQHRNRVKRSKKGRGLLANLMQMTTYPLLGKRLNAILQNVLENCIVKILPDFRFLYTRNLMAANGSFHSSFTRFGTVVHRDEMIGVGYMISQKHVVLSVNSNLVLRENNLENFVTAIKKNIIKIHCQRNKLSEGVKNEY